MTLCKKVSILPWRQISLKLFNQLVACSAEILILLIRRIELRASATLALQKPFKSQGRIVFYSKSSFESMRDTSDKNAIDMTQINKKIGIMKDEKKMDFTTLLV